METKTDESSGHHIPPEALALGFTNYRTIATKLLRPELAKRFESIAESLEIQARKRRDGAGAKPEIGEVLESIEMLVKDVTQEEYPQVRGVAADNRGALRAVTWGHKVMTITKSLVGRVKQKGDEILNEGQSFFVCDGCGFISIGEEPPAICPVCKAPAARFEKY